MSAPTAPRSASRSLDRVVDSTTGRALVTRLRGVLSASGPETVVLGSPASGLPVATLPRSTPDDIDAAVRRARAAQPAWAATPVRERAAVLLRLHDLLLDHRDELTDLLQAETGKDRLTAVNEVLHCALTARYYGRTAPRHLRSERGHGLVPLLTRIDRNYVPLGLVGVIAPWNYPLTLALSDGLAALAAGNAVLLKPDAQTPLVALRGIELLRAAGMPPDLWAVVVGPGDEVGPAVVGVADHVCFTGSTKTGRTVARQCAERLIGCSTELGGKNPLVVLDDADVDVAAAGAVQAAFSNGGQLCVGAERILVDEAVRPAFTAAFVARVAALRVGYALDFGPDLGGLVNARQLAVVRDQVEDARSQGATVLTGGRLLPEVGPFAYEPTVLTDVTAAMAVHAEETFGPVAVVYGFRGDDEAVALANDSAYGLNGSVWTRDHLRGRAVAARIRCGSMNVNDGFSAAFASVDAPMGGMKASGLGRRQGIEGIRRFVAVQSVATQSGPPLAPRGPVGPAQFVGFMTHALRVLKATGRP
ncbi:MAG TPA: succinic semialdehyde dehydrogenase [Friedmanniella sp.]